MIKISWRHSSIVSLAALLSITLLFSSNARHALAEIEEAVDTETAQASDVVDLEEEEFDSYIAKHQPVLVMFHAPNCGFCKKMKPAYEEAATKLKELGYAAKIVRVDGTENKVLLEQHNIQGFPTLKLFHDGETIDYHGGRTTDEITMWFLKMIGPTVKVIQDEKEADYESFDVYFIGHFVDENSEAYSEYSKLASNKRSTATYYAIFDAKKDSSIVAYRQNEGQFKYGGSTTQELEEFMDTESFALLAVLHPGNFESYLKRQMDFAWLDGTSKHYDDYAAVLREVAPHFRKNLSFVWVNSDLYVPNGETKGTGPKFMLNKISGTRFALPNPLEGLKDAAVIKKFLEDAINGDISPFIKSEPIPTENDEPVKVVVGDNFLNSVFQSDKDVMLEVYAPWCGHCKAFEPIYTKLAEKLQSTPSIVIAKMDGTANESPAVGFEWKAFPTIYFVKAGSKEPIVYEGQRQMEDLLTFINTHATTAIEAPKEEL